MFAAHLIGRARDSRVVDPVARQNLKNFVYQCFTWPFIITNLAPGSSEAQKAPDLLAFVASSPHPGLGVYWHPVSGEASFKSCRECVPLVREIMTLQKREGLAGILKGLFSTTKMTDVNRARLESYAGQGWSQLTNGSSNVFDMVGQQMLINAYREGLDDHRESFDLSRIDPRLVSHQATRAMETQNTGFLINGALIARNLPVLQNVLFGIFLFLFLLVLPLSLVPGGFRALGTWTKLLVWCQSWPVFYTILNCIGLWWLKSSVETTLLSSGGLTIMTQNGLTDAAYDAYCIVQNLLMAVPFLSWAVITGSGHALVSLSERMMTASGVSAASNMVDNTYTLDTQNLHNRTIATQQIAQQTLGSSLSTGHTVDDGQFRSVTGPDGNVAIQETTSNLGTSLHHSDSLQNSFADAVGSSEQATLSHQKAFSDAQAAALSNVSTLADQWGKGKVSSEDFSVSENANVQQSLQKLQDFGNRLSQNTSANTSTSSSLDAHAGVESGFSLGNLFSVKAGVNGRTGTAALNQEGLEMATNAGLSEQDTDQINSALSHAMTNRVSASSDMAQRASQDLRGNLDRLENASRQVSASHAVTKSLSQTASFLKSAGSTLNRNMMDDVLEYTAEKHFGGDKSLAARYQKTHASEFARDVQMFEQGFSNHILDQVMRGNGPSSSDGLRAHYEDYAAQVKGSVTDHRGELSALQEQAGLSGVQAEIRSEFEAGESVFTQTKEGTDQILQNHHRETQSVHDELYGQGQKNIKSSTLARAGKEALGNGEETLEYLKKKVN
tara:strand:- start:1260 stop:3608 length:2349 start_codon:yes stop_codon:yes gene_type:complete